MFRIILLGLAAAFAAGLLFVNVYNSVVDAANWEALPDSMLTARAYFHAASPGTFFRIASPINQLLSLIAVIACWKMGKARYIAIAAFVLAVSADLLTFGYFYPRLEIMFNAPFETDADRVRLAVEQWSSMNWIRTALCVCNTALSMAALIFVSKRKEL